MAFSYGCATKTAFIYDHPDLAKAQTGTRLIAVKPVADEREDANLDAIYENDVRIDIGKAIADELNSTGLFREVVLLDPQAGEDDIRALSPDLVLTPALCQLLWEVPNYNDVVAKTFAISILTGGIGGAIYGSTGIDVKGHAQLEITLVDANGDTLLEKKYTGLEQREFIKLSCDTPETKATVAGKALKICLEELKADLAAVMTQQAQAGQTAKP